METLILLTLLTVIISVIYKILQKDINFDFIINYNFPPDIKNKFKSKYKTLSNYEIDLVFEGLRQFFIVTGKNNLRFYTLPSRVINDAWKIFTNHEVIYRQFCNTAFKTQLNYTPTANTNNNYVTTSITRTWIESCKLENIDPSNPKKIPLLFDLDKRLSVKNGFYYFLDNNYQYYKNQSNHYSVSNIIKNVSYVG